MARPENVMGPDKESRFHSQDCVLPWKLLTQESPSHPTVDFRKNAQAIREEKAYTIDSLQVVLIRGDSALSRRVVITSADMGKLKQSQDSHGIGT